MPRRRNLSPDKAAPFTSDADKTPFLNPRNVIAAQDWFLRRSKNVTYALVVADLYGRWQHRSNETFSNRRIRVDYGLSLPTVKLVKQALCELAQLEEIETLNSHGRPSGFYLKRCTNPVVVSEAQMEPPSTTYPGISGTTPDISETTQVHARHTDPGHHGDHPPLTMVTTPGHDGDHPPLTTVTPSKKGLKTSSQEQVQEVRTKSKTTSVSNGKRDITAIRTTLETAIREFNRKQEELGGRISDPQTLGSLMQVTFNLDLSAEQVAAACDDADDLTYAWHWSQGRPSPYDAGRCLCAALKGDLRDELEPGINCSPDLDFEQEQPQEAPAALDKGEQPRTPAVAASTALQGHAGATEVVIAPHTPTEPDRPLVPAVAQIAEQRKEQRETIETRTVMTDAELAARREAVLRQFQPQAAHSPGRYGTPPEALTQTQAA